MEIGFSDSINIFVNHLQLARSVMSNLIYFMLFLYLNSIHIFAQQDRFEEMCIKFVEFYNIMNKITVIDMKVNFELGSSLLWGYSKIEFSNKDIIASCTLIEISNSTYLVTAEVTSDFNIYSMSRKNVSVCDGVIFTTMFLAKEDDKVVVKSLSVENSGFSNATTEIGGSLQYIASDHIIPFLSRALRKSALFVNKVLKQESRRQTLYANDLLHDTIKYYLGNLVTD